LPCDPREAVSIVFLAKWRYYGQNIPLSIKKNEFLIRKRLNI